MALSADELFEAAIDLPPAQLKELALRLLESVEVVDESIDEKWGDEIASRVEDIVNGTVKTIPGEEVFARSAARLAERQAARET